MSRLKEVLGERLACSKLECDLHELCLELEKELNSRPVSREQESELPAQAKVICKV